MLSAPCKRASHQTARKNDIGEDSIILVMKELERRYLLAVRLWRVEVRVIVWAACCRESRGNPRYSFP